MLKSSRISISMFVEFSIKKEPKTRITSKKEAQLVSNDILYVQFHECVPKNEIIKASICTYTEEIDEVIHQFIDTEHIKLIANALKSQIYTKYLQRNIINPKFHIIEDLSAFGFDVAVLNSIF